MPLDADVRQRAVQLQCRILHLCQTRFDQPPEGPDLLLRGQREKQLVAGAREGLFKACHVGGDAFGEQAGPHVSVCPGVGGRGSQPQAAPTRRGAFFQLDAETGVLQDRLQRASRGRRGSQQVRHRIVLVR